MNGRDVLSFCIGALVPWALPSCHPRAEAPRSQAEAPALPGGQPAPKTADEADQRIAGLKAQLAALESEAVSLRDAEHARLIRRWCYGVASFFGLALLGCGIAAFFVPGLRSELATGAAASAAVSAAALWGASHVELVTFAGGAVVFIGAAWVVWRFHRVHVSRDAVMRYAHDLEITTPETAAVIGGMAKVRMGKQVASLRKRAARIGVPLFAVSATSTAQAAPPTGAASKAG